MTFAAIGSKKLPYFSVFQFIWAVIILWSVKYKNSLITSGQFGYPEDRFSLVKTNIDMDTTEIKTLYLTTCCSFLQGSHKLWKSWKTWKITKKVPCMEKSLNFNKPE